MIRQHSIVGQNYHSDLVGRTTLGYSEEQLFRMIGTTTLRELHANSYRGSSQTESDSETGMDGSRLNQTTKETKWAKVK